MSGTEEPYVFTTLRWDPTLASHETESKSIDPADQFYLLAYHADRLRDAFDSGFLDDNTNLPRPTQPTALVKALSDAVSRWYETPGNGSAKCLRIKHRIYGDGRIVTECWPIPRLPRSTLLPSTLGSPETLRSMPTEWTLVLDSQATESSSSTRCKTSDRAAYDRARIDAGISSLAAQQEVLLFAHNGHIIDASITTPYFFRSGFWITPPASSGGQRGTTRRWALERGLALEEDIHKDELHHGQIVWLSNAVRGFFPSRITTVTGNNAASTNAT